MKITLNKHQFDLHNISSFNTEILDEYELLVFRLIENWENGTETFIFHTSGSTGKPKEIIASRSHLSASAKRTLAYFNIKSGIILNCLSTNHIGGAMQVIRALVGDLDLVVVSPSKQPFGQLFIDWGNVQLLSLVPYQLDFLLHTMTDELKRCRHILLGGAPLTNSLKTRLNKEAFTNIYETYGMTETLSHIALKNSTKDTLFTTLKGISITFDNRNCLTITDDLLELSNLKTNDIVALKSNKTFQWLGRHDNVINSGGLKFIAEDLERKINNLFPQKNILIFSQPHPSLGEEINLLIEGLFFEIEKGFFEPVLSKYETPKKVHFIKKFIRTKTDKVLREQTINLLVNSQ